MSKNQPTLREVLGHWQLITPEILRPHPDPFTMFMVPAHLLEGSPDSTAKQTVTMRKYTCFIEDKPPQPKRNQTQ